jgi:hypothetical protein
MYKLTYYLKAIRKEKREHITSDMILSEINLIFPLPFTWEPFPLVIETMVGEANYSR